MTLGASNLGVRVRVEFTLSDCFCGLSNMMYILLGLGLGSGSGLGLVLGLGFGLGLALWLGHYN